MSVATTYIKLIAVPLEITGTTLEDGDNHFPRHEFEGLVFPTITPNGIQRGAYIVRLLDAMPNINTHRPILAEWLIYQIPKRERASTYLTFEAEICREVPKEELVFNFS